MVVRRKTWHGDKFKAKEFAFNFLASTLQTLLS
jgi:hypothetical protein